MNKPASKCPESTQRAFEAGGDAVPWLRDADLMGELVRDAMHYWETSHDPGGRNVFDGASVSAWCIAWRGRRSSTVTASTRGRVGMGSIGDVVSLGKTLKHERRQKGELLARVLGQRWRRLPEYRTDLVYAHTYLVLVD